MLITYLGDKASATVPALVSASLSENPDVRREVLFALAAIGPDSVRATPVLEKELTDPNAANRAVAAYALGKIGRGAKAAAKPARRTAERRSAGPRGQCVRPGEHRSAK